MFIELTEILRCPHPHDESYLICGPVTMDGRDVVRGGLSCPVCRADYPIVDGVAWFSPPFMPPPGPPLGRSQAPEPSSLTAVAAQTFLSLEGGGGYVLLLGAAGRLAVELAALVPHVAFVAVNPPQGPKPGWPVSSLHAPTMLPIRRHSVRGAVIGPDAVHEPWLSAAVGTVLTGLRVIVESETANPVGVVEVVRGAGVFVGEKRAK